MGAPARRGRRLLAQRRCAEARGGPAGQAMNRARAAKESWRARSGTWLAIATPISTPSGERTPITIASRSVDVAVGALADRRRPGRRSRSSAARSTPPAPGRGRGRRSAPARRGCRRRRRPGRRRALPRPRSATARTSFIGARSAHCRISSIAIATSSAAKRRETVRCGDPLLDRGADHDADDRRDRQQQAGDDVDVAVDAALGERAERADQDDRGEAGAGREPLPVAEPEDQQGDDDRAAADPEEAAEDARRGADRGELQRWLEGIAELRAASCGDTRCRASRIRDGRRRRPGRRCSKPLRAEPARAAILTDVDGTLAPIVERPEQAAVPRGARGRRSPR